MMRLSALALAMTLGLITTTSAHAASTATLLLQGIVQVVNNITVTPTGTANTSLNITGGETAKIVASVQEQSNNATGYKINVKSLNGGELRNLSDANKKTTYQLSYDGASPISIGTNYVQVKNVIILAGLATDTSEVKVNVNALANATAGTYEDTVTFQIVAN